LKVKYEGPEENTEATFLLRQSTGIPVEAPALRDFGGGHRQILAFWEVVERVEYSDKRSRAPSGVTMYLLEAGQGTRVFPAKITDGITDQEGGECVVDTSANAGSNCVSCNSVDGSWRYFDLDKVNTDIIRYQTAETRVGQTSISGLDVNNDQGEKKRYIGFLSYAPQGAGFSTCFVSEAFETQTLMEYLATGARTEKGDPTCFIASAVYGDPNLHQVKVLRWFRDHKLNRHFVGKAMIGFYNYVGPVLAEFVDGREYLRQILRRPIDWISYKIESFYSQ
jgi:hypothetical protein